MKESRYISFKEASMMLNLHHTTIRQRKADTEMLTHVNQGRRKFLIRSEVEALVESKIRGAVEQDKERKTLLRMAS
jgi:hypothetical protein